MAETELKIEVKLDSAAKKEIAKLREQKRRIDKDIKRVKASINDEDKLENWKMLDVLKKEIVGRLAKQNVGWNKFVKTPDWFEYAWYVSSGVAGTPRRLKTSMTKPSATETKTDEATMIKLAKEQRSKIVRRRQRKKSTKTTAPKSTGKGEAIAKANIS